MGGYCGGRLTREEDEEGEGQGVKHITHNCRAKEVGRVMGDME